MSDIKNIEDIRRFIECDARMTNATVNQCRRSAMELGLNTEEYYLYLAYHLIKSNDVLLQSLYEQRQLSTIRNFPTE